MNEAIYMPGIKIGAQPIGSHQGFQWIWKQIAKLVRKAGRALKGAARGILAWVKEQDEQSRQIYDAVERSKDGFYQRNPWAIRGLH